MKWLDDAAKYLLIAGGLNWGTITFFNYNFVTALLGAGIAPIVGGAVGIAAVMEIVKLFK